MSRAALQEEQQECGSDEDGRGDNSPPVAIYKKPKRGEYHH